MKLNRGALKFCGVYTVFFILMAWAGHSANNGNGDSFFSQLAIMPVFAPLAWLGLLEFIRRTLGWTLFFLFSILSRDCIFHRLGNQRIYYLQ